MIKVHPCVSQLAASTRWGVGAHADLESVHVQSIVNRGGIIVLRTIGRCYVIVLDKTK